MGLTISMIVWDDPLTYTLVGHGVIVRLACTRVNDAGQPHGECKANVVVVAASKHTFPAIDFGVRVLTICALDA